ncbi:3-oxoacyl-[acyl-carrier-protein] synthase II [Nocardioides zeae]|uniref:3-oxoacyl-[acyl-carrier-protein] synthase II n=2 Tax=Nocardioides zeae TaxID=1457234 RepID=A0ACC6IHU1_9ACTN|nr:beta-ketoacyl synthase N-terminal-like domain-containing protein [Nocardioides zeae]MDQ1104104.1 3-oxoacyl-[acyl-carrier-protein] synthase II [Nocardioides zeae]MDR6176205.1 3-oxoacyl-[acyl-carrier-protein] synthase II [Nocardioides zeae]MDR6210351.1 3-oxoacyl-[acyl-carrier-protein] synthase II [Nocardioides zeae]
MTSLQRSARDAVVTGMGFCLPGSGGRPSVTAADVWRTASTGSSHLDNDGFFHGIVHGAREEFAARFPEVPARHLRSYADVHLYGAVALDEAARDAGLDRAAGDLRDAAVLTARAGVDSNYDAYRAWHDADPATIDAASAKSLFVALVIAGTNSDVGAVQASLCSSQGPSFTVSCGCASSAVLLGIARTLIATRQSDLVVVTGADRFDVERVLHGDALREVVEREQPVQARHNDEPPAAPRHDRRMRPYDARSDCMNYGDGAVTLVLESRERADRRGASNWGTVRAQATTRSGLGSAVGIDTSGSALVEASRACLEQARLDLDEIGYVNGGAEGDPLFARIEANAVAALWGTPNDLLVSSQEGAFGHSGAPLGNLGAALTLMMMRERAVCPSAGCEEPSPVLTFDPVAGTAVRRRAFEHALSFNYQIGGVNSALLLGADRER